jgi:hypothetical protein
METPRSPHLAAAGEAGVDITLAACAKAMMRAALNFILEEGKPRVRLSRWMVILRSQTPVIGYAVKDLL